MAYLMKDTNEKLRPDGGVAAEELPNTLFGCANVAHLIVDGHGHKDTGPNTYDRQDRL